MNTNNIACLFEIPMFLHNLLQDKCKSLFYVFIFALIPVCVCHEFREMLLIFITASLSLSYRRSVIIAPICMPSVKLVKLSINKQLFVS